MMLSRRWGQGDPALIPDTLSVGTAITHRLTHPADGSPFGAPSVKGNLSCSAAHFYGPPCFVAISSFTRSAQRFHQPGVSIGARATMPVPVRCRGVAVACRRWTLVGSEGGDRRFPPPVERRRLFILDPLHERHQALRLTLDVVGPSAAQTGRGRFLWGHLLVSLVLAVHAELLEVVGFFVHWAEPPVTRRGGRSDSQRGGQDVQVAACSTPWDALTTRYPMRRHEKRPFSPVFEDTGTRSA